MNKKSAFCSGFYFPFVVYGSLPTGQYNYKKEKGATHKMREKWQKQMPLVDPAGSHPQEKELEAISNIIVNTPIIVDRVLQDLNRGKIIGRRKGANGMSAEQVLRAAIVMFLFDFTYEQLAFHINDSRSLRRFCDIGITDKGFKKSALNKNIKAIGPETWEAIMRDIVGYAKDQGIEKGRKARIDCTVVKTDIHTPSDSTLLWDSVRALTRLIQKAKEDTGAAVSFSDHQRRAKRRMVAIQYAKRKSKRFSAYKDLLKVTHRVCGYAQRSIEALENCAVTGSRGLMLTLEIKHYLGLARRVIEQTERRVLNGEKVPAEDKIVSIFEPHTDIICKDNRDTYYGHKICLTGGGSNLILDCKILGGNPADVSLVGNMLDRQKEIYGRYPLKVAFDGGFASKDNLIRAQEREIKDVCFAKKRGLSETDMCRSEYVYKKLRRFRAGIESGISWLKRSFGLARCNWKGLRSFKCYVLGAVVAANLLTIARKQMAAA
jgi:IS5 family transposase